MQCYLQLSGFTQNLAFLMVQSSYISGKKNQFQATEMQGEVSLQSLSFLGVIKKKKKKKKINRLLRMEKSFIDFFSNPAT